ncbi:MAG: hypothetical protein KC593_19590 [Myxococcales bacterium]|nr:hypothetical protein [Myxococcales bacterium]MCA9574686.1 hypothetical protein [Myxococcales bacterium]
MTCSAVMTGRRAPLGALALLLVLMTTMDVSAQQTRSTRDESVDLELQLEPCVAHLEARLREIIAIELRTSARVDEHAARVSFVAQVRCEEDGVVLSVRSEGEDAQTEQYLDAAALRGPDPARTLALSIVELLEPALAEAEARSAADDARDEARRAAAREAAASSPWGLAAALVWRPPFASHPNMGGLRARVLRHVGHRLRVELGAHLERGRRKVALGRVFATSLAVDASLLAVWFVGDVRWATGAGLRVGEVFWRGRPSEPGVTGSRLRSAQLDLFVRGLVDWYLAERWALRVDLELGGAMAGSRAAAVAGEDSTNTSVTGFRAAVAVGVVRAF